MQTNSIFHDIKVMAIDYLDKVIFEIGSLYRHFLLKLEKEYGKQSSEILYLIQNTYI